MKNILVLLFLLSINFCFSQNFQSAKDRDKDKPYLFSEYSDTLSVHPGFFNSMSSVKLNDIVNIQVTKQIIFKGIVNILHETTDYRTVSIESQEIPTLRIILSYTSEDKYYGIIGCINHKDVLYLRYDQINKEYIWIKREFADMIPD